MGLLGGAAGHGLVVRVQVGIIVDLKSLRVEGGGDLSGRVSISASHGGGRGADTYLGPDGVLDWSVGAHGGELSSDARKAERVSSKHEVECKWFRWNES